MDWHAMVLLGAYHGVNPGMGWLFAVALGLQDGSARGVLRALPPIALGHAASVGIVVSAAAFAGLVLPAGVLTLAVGVTLTTLGLYQLRRHRHPRYGGMRVGFRDLTVWSFLMASAHGAGVMVLPFVLPAPVMLMADGHHHSMHSVSPAGGLAVGAASVAVHTAACLAVMTLIAWFVYRRLGVGFLRRAWLNLDWLWAGALCATGVFVLLS